MQGPERLRASPKRSSRPFSVTALMVLVLSFTGMQILRVWATLANWSFLNTLPLSVPPTYFLLSGGFWAATGGLIFWGLWRRNAWATWATRLAAVAFTVAYWVDRLFLQAKGPQVSNEPFAAFMTVLLLVAVFMSLAGSRARAYFGDRNGQTLKD